MSYDPTAPTEDERNNAYFLIWAGTAGSVILLMAQFLALPNAISTVAILAIATSLLVAILSRRNDDYFRHLTQVASKFAMGVIALWFGFAAVIHMANGGHFLGVLAAGATPMEVAAKTASDWISAETVTVIVALAFHVRFLAERYRR